MCSAKCFYMYKPCCTIVRVCVRVRVCLDVHMYLCVDRWTLCEPTVAAFVKDWVEPLVDAMKVPGVVGM